MLLLGDCNHWLKEIKDESIDLICTDPPYGIEFMGKDWDKALVNAETWKECYRVLKQGKLAFVMCSPRQDVLSRMIVNLQDAGFRTNYTSIYWTFASGFPKAANVSKLIDKRNGKPSRSEELEQYLCGKIKEKYKTHYKLAKELGVYESTVRNWIGKHAGHRIYPNLEQWNILKEKLGLDNRFDELIEWQEAEREIVGQSNNKIHLENIGNAGYKEEWNITKPATEEAKKMEGAYVGFQPKPALEIILQAQKPFSPEGELIIITSECLHWIQCQSVNNVKNNSSLLQTVRDFIAQNIAMDKIVEEATANIGKVAESFVAMDTLKSTLAELTEKQDTNWNTVTLWKIILIGLLAKGNRFTTETITEQIIELKTLNLLLSQSITNNTTPPEKTQQSGNKLNVSIVENILANALIRLLNTQNTIVHSNVSEQETSLTAKLAVKDSESFNTTRTLENTAVSNAIDGLEVKVILVVSKGKTLTWLDDCRIPYQSDDKWERSTTSMQDIRGNNYNNPDKKYVYRDPQEANEKGRFPANLLVSDDVLNDGKITKSGTIEPHHICDSETTKTAYGKYKRIPTNEQTSYGDSGSYSRYFSLDAWAKTFPFLVTPKASASERNKGCEDLEQKESTGVLAMRQVYSDTIWIRKNPPTQEELSQYLKEKINNSGLTQMEIRKMMGIPLKGGGPITHWITFGLPQSGLPTKDEWIKLKEILQFDDKYDKQMTEFIEVKRQNDFQPTKPKHNHHPTVKPLKLMSYLITMGSREGDLVLDPFCGSGTVCIAAHQLHRKWLGIEMNPEYVEIIKKRLADPLAQLKLTSYLENEVPQT